MAVKNKKRIMIRSARKRNKEQKGENKMSRTKKEKPAVNNEAEQELEKVTEQAEEAQVPDLENEAENAEEESEACAAEKQETEETTDPETEKMQKAMDAANAKADEYLAMAQRVQADFENFRRRNESVRADAFADGRKDVAGMMLPVLDNLERALAAAENTTDEALKNGLELVLKQMNDIYRKLEVTPIDRLGEKFDPNLENAVMQGTPEDGEPGTVCMVLQKGYMIGEKVLRHAMVKVVPE